MVDSLRHRGPDQGAVITAGVCGLGNRHLATLDRSADLPMRSADAQLIVAYDGAIYNHPEIRRGMELEGLTYRTNSAAELLLTLYQRYNVEMLRSLRGMFAFALWDQRSQRLLLARDRMGEKPLYYYQNEHIFVFASEIKALLAHPAVPRQSAIDGAALARYLAYGYFPAPETAFRDIKMLLPGHLISIRDGQAQIAPYWTLPHPREAERLTTRFEAEKLGSVREAIGEAVRQSLISDVPLGAFLSGGLDSSLIVALMRRHSSANIQTFSLSFEDSDSLDETDFARQVASHLHADHTAFTVKPQALDLLPLLVWHHDQPFGDSSAIPTYLISKLTREHVTVALTGDGADELFAGYDRFYALELVRRLGVLPRWLWSSAARLLNTIPENTDYYSFDQRTRRFIHGAVLPPALAYFDFVRLFDARQIAQLRRDCLRSGRSALPEVFRPARSGGADRTARSQHAHLSARRSADQERPFQPGRLAGSPRPAARSLAGRDGRHHPHQSQAARQHHQIHPQAAGAGTAARRDRPAPQVQLQSAGGRVAAPGHRPGARNSAQPGGASARPARFGGGRGADRRAYERAARSRPATLEPAYARMVASSVYRSRRHPPPMNRPIRVLNIIARLNVGGPAIHVTLLTEKLGAPDYESTLVCGTIGAGEGDMLYYAEAHGVQPIIVPELGRSLHPVRDLVTIWQVYRLIRRLKPDVVHTHTAKAGFVGRVAAWLAGVPVIVHTFHGHVFRGYFSPTMTQVFLNLERLTARMSSTVITLSEGLRRELADDYHITSADHITVLPLGLDLAPFAAAQRHNGAFRREYGIPADAPLIGIIGRIVPVKNHALFLEAAAQVKAELPAARFVIVGDGELRAEVEAQVDALGLRELVIFTGWLRDLAPVYADLDVNVISSINEGTPVSVIEALAAACPVVATAVGGLPDLLDQGALGRLVPSADDEALAAALIAVLRDPPDMQAARALMLDRYNLDRLMSQFDALYRRLLAQKN